MMMNSLSVNTSLLPTGGLSRWRCSSIQRLKLKAFSLCSRMARYGMRCGAHDVTLSTNAHAVAARRQAGKPRLARPRVMFPPTNSSWSGLP